MKTQFSKYEGLGNDFIVIERPEIDAPTVRTLCDRRLGIGADGVLLLSEGGVNADYQMVVWNADGSIAEMCGNGLRCVGQYLKDKKIDQDSYRISTGAGVLAVWPQGDTVSAEVGSAQDLGRHTIHVDGQEFNGHWISTGNPHFVMYGEWSAEDKETYGPILEQHPLFPEGANISFAQLSENGVIHLAVWERGCGLTQACGTGACATVAAGQLSGILMSELTEYEVHLPGGVLWISGNPEWILMRGPARHVYDGVWPGE